MVIALLLAANGQSLDENQIYRGELLEKGSKESENCNWYPLPQKLTNDHMFVGTCKYVKT